MSTQRNSGKKLTSERLIACAAEGKAASFALSQYIETIRTCVLTKPPEADLWPILIDLLLRVPPVPVPNCQDEINWFRDNKKKILTERNRRRAQIGLTGGEMRADNTSFIHDFPDPNIEKSSFTISDLASGRLTPPSMDAPPSPEELAAYEAWSRGEITLAKPLIHDPEGIPSLDDLDLPEDDASADDRQVAKFVGYSGDICNNCGGARTIRTGTCLTCQDCGETSGCA